MALGPGADAAAAYRAAHQAAVVAPCLDLGRILFHGDDAADLLHRLTTNHVNRLRPGEGAAALFTTPKGRILDLVTIHALPPGFLVLTAPGRARPVAAWVERYTFREKVRAEDLSQSHGTLGLFGARAVEVASRLFGAAAAALPLHHGMPIGADPAGGWVTRAFPLAGAGYHFTLPKESVAGWDRRLRQEPGIVPAGPEVLEALRIEAGMPGPGAELTEEHNPWEAGLADAIALDKGCYVGQEVIARLHTYDKVSRHLVRLELPGGEVPPRGAEVRRDGETIGQVTSAARPPGGPRGVALAYVKREEAPGSPAVRVAWEGGAADALLLGPAR
jgi:aminomethyltransferase